MRYCQNYPYYALEDNFSRKFNIIRSIHDLICKDDDSGQEAYLDSNTPIFDDEWLALDLDELERELAQNRDNKEPNKSMDMGFMVSNSDKTVFVLVEIRFNFSQFKNIKKDDLDDKVFYSTICVNNTLNNINIYPNKYFLFAKNKVQQGRRRLQNMNPRCSQDYQAIGVDNLYQLFFSTIK